MSTGAVPTLRRVIAAMPGARRLKRWLVGPRGVAEVPTTRPADRETPPEPDHAELCAAYERSPLCGAPDTFVLYRIIGNDLVPRHRRGQSRENLAFILEHEPELRDCEKRFVVNRIVDREQEEAILALLDAAGMPYLHIPFDLEEYRRQPWDIAGIPSEYAPYTRRFAALRPAEQDQIRMRLHRHKNRYVMNNNGARNAALRDGRGRAKWVLPWDGNCFLTYDAWEALRASVAASPHVPYRVVPMARVTDNRTLLAATARPAADSEPQILFRSDSELEFDAERFYGRRPKVELLWRLGVTGPWDRWAIQPWDLPVPGYAREAGCFLEAGWVARLSSGRPELESEDSDGGGATRHHARVRAVTDLLARLDRKAFAPALAPEEPIFAASHGRADADLLQQLRKAAEGAGGEIVPSSLQRLFETCFVLALAWARLNDGRYAEQAAHVVRRWLLDGPAGRNHGARAGDRGILETTGLFYFLDAVRLLRKAGALRALEYADLQDRVARHLDWLRHSDLGRRERDAPTHRGTRYDLQVAAIAAFLGDYLLLRDTLRDSRFRITVQFDTQGRQPHELSLPESFNGCCANLQGWIYLSILADSVGEHLWEYEGPRRQSLDTAFKWLLGHMGREWPYPQVSTLDSDRLLPIYSAYEERLGADTACVSPTTLKRSHVKPIFAALDGVQPFWQLR